MSTQALFTSALLGFAVVAACPAAGVDIDRESAPIVNIASGQAIEVPPPVQPGDESERIMRERSPALQAGSSVRSQPMANSTEGRALVSSKQGSSKTGLKTSGAPEAAGESWLGHWTVRTAAGLGVLVAMLWGLKWSAKRFGAGLGLAAQLGPAGRAPQGLLEVLGRYPVSRGHSLVLLKLDRRVLLLGQSQNGFTTLSELTDPEDVASVLTKAADADGVSMSRRFSELLRGMERDPSLVDGVAASAGAAPVTPRLAMRLAGAVTGSGGGAP